MKVFRSAILAGISLTAMSTPALAQNTSAEEEATSGETEIIVQARRRDESVQDVPLVVSAITSEAIEKLNLRDARELVALVPGLDLRNDGYASSVQLRGLNFNINAGASASVSTYLNDAPIQTRALLSQMYDIAQVEVLHGPQGTLRGQAAPSGSITFTTRKPDLEEVGVYLSGTAATQGSGNVNGAMNIPIVKGVLGIRLAGVWDRNRNNRVRSISPYATFRSPFSEEKGGRVSVLFQPTDWFRAEATYQTIDFESASYNQYASYSLVNPTAAASPVTIRPEDRLSIQNTPSLGHQHYNIYNWRAELRYAGQKLIYQGSKVDFDSFSQANQNRAALPILLGTETANTGRDTYQYNTLNSPASSHEIRLQNEERVAGIFDYVLGYYHTKGTANIRVTQETYVVLPTAFGGPFINTAVTDTVGTDGTPNPTAANARPAPPSYETSFFGNITAHIGDAFEISGGLRHISITQAPVYLNIPALGNNLQPYNPAGTNDQKWIYTASAKYRITPDFMVYFATGTSYRPGPSVFNNDAATATSALQQSFVQMKPEDSQSYELGFKSEWLDRKVMFNLTAYHQTFQNYTYLLSNGVYFVANDGTVKNSSQFAASVPVTLNGVDLELGLRFSKRFNVNLVASYVDSKIKNGIVPCNDLNGDQVPDVVTSAPTAAQLGGNTVGIGSCKANFRATTLAPFSATLQAEYAAPLNDRMEAFGRGLFSFYGASQNDPSVSYDDIGAYGLLNLFAGVRAANRSWELTFFGKNVFNTTRYTRFDGPATTSYQAPFLGGGQNLVSTYSQITTTAPREFGVNLRVAFGSR